MLDPLESWLTAQGVGEGVAALVVTATAAAAVILAGVVANLVARHLLVRAVHALIRRSRTTWDDALVERNVLVRLSHLAPPIVLHVAAPLVLAEYPSAVAAVQALATIYMAIIGLLVVDAFLNAVLDVYRRYEISRRVHLRSFVQVLQVILSVLLAIFILSRLMGRSPLFFFSGLGAFTAVLLLIFKDAILGLVAGVQLMSNNMVRVGDWIEMPRHGADGYVIDVSLTTIKVQNWDKTISTIPTYHLISDSFRNWRGMTESGGRRIKRSVIIDIHSIRFCDAEMIGRFKKIEHIRSYIEHKVEEIDRHNQEHEVDEAFLVNGRHLTNVGTFRAYVEAYLRKHPAINRDLTFLVRQLEPTAQGLPIQVYVFLREQAWARYEAIQADLFDHILAVVPLFDLRVFQEPAGADLWRLAPRGHDGGTRPV
jgi:miniconductance mechanosensitive channel